MVMGVSYPFEKVSIDVSKPYTDSEKKYLHIKFRGLADEFNGSVLSKG